MQKVRVSRIATAALLILLSISTPAFAVNKDMVQLQTQVQQLLDAVARLQQSNDERMGVLKDLVQQSADSVNRMTQNMDALQKQLAAQQGAEGTKVDQVSGQVQALNDSLDEIKARMNRLEKLLSSVESQQQSMGAAMQNMPQGSVPATSQPSNPAPEPTTSNPPPGSALVDPPVPARRPVAAPVRSTAPPVEDLYKAAYGDYMSAKYAVAQSEFGDVIRNYPDHSLSGNSYYYLGEMDYRAGKYAAAAKDYDKVLEQFPDSNKIPASHLHKGQALIALKQNDAGVRELRALIQRFPNSPEAAQARSRLSGLGIPVKPRP
jgi:tol-pal system protein YbgF